jgi:predicted transcriptional regulator
MRMHIELDDDLVRRIDAIAGPRGRSRFVRDALEHAIDRERRWRLIESAFGAVADEGHDWDADPAGWVHAQRFSDPKRVG